MLYACERMRWVKTQRYLQQQYCVYNELRCHGLTCNCHGHQEDHTFLFWLYKAVIRSKKTKS